MLLDMRDRVIEPLESIGEAVGELYACMLVIFEEMRESKLICVLVFLILY